MSHTVNRIFKSLLIVLLLVSPVFADLIVHVHNSKGDLVAVVSVPAGGYVDVIERGSAPPLPNPNPPNVDPPNPPAVVAKFVVLIIDNTPGKMSSTQLAAIADQNLRAQIKAAGLNYSEFPVDSPIVQQPPPTGRSYAKTFMQPNNLTAPCIVLADSGGKYIRGAPMPPDAAGIMAFITGGK